LTSTLPRAAVAVVLALTLGGGGFVLGASAQAAADGQAGVTRVQPTAGGRGVLVVDGRPDATRIEAWSPDPAGPYPVRAGRAPAADDEVAVDVVTALALGIRLGQTVGVQGLAAGTFRVVGLVGCGARVGSPDYLALVSTPTARRLLGPDAGR
jgi:putative ABC transport system permease protein